MFFLFFLTDNSYLPTIVDKIFSLLLPLINVSALLLAIFITIVLLAFPCLPPFTFSITPDCRHGVNITNWNLRVSLAIFDGFMSYQITVSGIFYMTLVVIAGCITLFNYLRIIEGWHGNR